MSEYFCKLTHNTCEIPIVGQSWKKQSNKQQEWIL